MFGTVLYDVFTSSERADVHATLEELCSPKDQYGWASVGIYTFYDPENSKTEPPGIRLQYIGLARDLPERFGQHAGLIPTKDGSCKKHEIDIWFSTHSELGFSCFVQSGLAQADTHRERARFAVRSKTTDSRDVVSNPSYGLDSATIIEGQLIETYRLLHKRLPPWNKRGASADGQGRAASGSGAGLLPMLDGSKDSLFRARRTLRELCDQAKSAEFEFGILHVARSKTLMQAIDRGVGDSDIHQTLSSLAKDPLYALADVATQVTDLFRSGYLDRR